MGEDCFAEHRRVLGANIRAIRIDRCQTQASLARDLGVSSRTILRIENGQTWPSIPTLIALADALYCSISDIVGALDPHDETVDLGLPEESWEYPIPPHWPRYEGIDPTDLDDL